MENILQNFKDGIKLGIQRSMKRKEFEEFFGEDPEDLFGPDWEDHIVEFVDSFKTIDLKKGE